MIGTDKPKRELIFKAEALGSEVFTKEESETILALQVAMHNREPYEKDGQYFRVNEVCLIESSEGEKYEIYGEQINER